MPGECCLKEPLMLHLCVLLPAVYIQSKPLQKQLFKKERGALTGTKGSQGIHTKMPPWLQIKHGPAELRAWKAEQNRQLELELAAMEAQAEQSAVEEELKERVSTSHGHSAAHRGRR
eukprot:1138506-Pelagomonas_calceolata.AAC.5